jgi:hypothetical protein
MQKKSSGSINYLKNIIFSNTYGKYQEKPDRRPNVPQIGMTILGLPGIAGEMHVFSARLSVKAILKLPF